MTRHPAAIRARIARNLAIARIRAGLSLRQAAAPLGWPYQTIQHFEKGRRHIDAWQLVLLAGVYGVPPADILDGCARTAGAAAEAAKTDRRHG